MEKFRPALRDARGEITPAARQIHQLVLADLTLKNDADPNVTFAMSEQMRTRHNITRAILLVDLKVAQRPANREKRLSNMRQALEDSGIPHWKRLPEEQKRDW
jgi:hypothetical protein